MAKAGLPIKKAEGKSTPVPVKIVNDTAKPSIDHDAEDRKWKAEQALRDIERAEGHKRDKALMKDVKACAKEKMKAYGKL